jgi:hypothetical protein
MRQNLTIDDCGGDLATYHYWKDYRFTGGGYKHCYEALTEVMCGTCVESNHKLEVIRTPYQFSKTKKGKKNRANKRWFYGELRCVDCDKTLDTLSKKQFNYLNQGK